MKNIIKHILKVLSTIISVVFLFTFALLSSSCECDDWECSLAITYLFPDGVVEYSAPCESYLTIYNKYWDDENPTRVIPITPPSLICDQVYVLATCHGKGKVSAIMKMSCSEIGPSGRPPRIKAQYESGWVVKPKLDCSKNTQSLILNMYETVRQDCN